MEVTPNIIAWLALIACIPVVIVLFRLYPAPKACALSILGCAMFLPEKIEWDPPLLPPFDKATIPALGALIGLLLWHRDRVDRRFQRIDWLFGLLLVGNVITVLNNSDRVPYAGEKSGFREGLTSFDVLSMSIRDSLQMFALFFLGRTIFNGRNALYTFATVLAACGLVYSIPILIESRLSPQLHNWIYGYHQFFFVQSIRFGGYRPMVFMTHGLTLTRFMLTCLLCAAALARAQQPVWRASWLWVLYLMFILLVCRSAGAWVLAAVSLPVVCFASAKTQIRFATLLGVFVLAYPMLRASDMIPVEDVVDWAQEYIGPDRADSLSDRFEQEDLLIDRVQQRRWFGWGPVRYNVYDENRKGVTVVDGEWLHTFGRRGTWGFLCSFGLYLAPVWAARRRIGQLRRRDANLVAGLTVLVAVVTFDNIPNASGTLPQYFYAGVLYGAIMGLAKETARERIERKRQQLEAKSPPRPVLSTGRTRPS